VIVIKIKRVYEEANSSDGTRLLIERLWPRGMRKDSLSLDGWLKEAGPSTTLRKWFSHDPAKWDEFQRRYFAELEAHPRAWRSITEAARHGTVTLIYSSHDEEHNNAIALQAFLKCHTKRK
jgi:uncharacterized protein YeaO (DUF488 family)